MACRVVVIGWMGSKKRYLQKYANLWLRSGDHEVLVLRPSVAMTLMRWRGVVKAGSDIDRVARMHIENPNMPTIYHIFSTGGFIHAGTMWRWMDEVEDVVMRRDLLEEVKGIIFDSGPAHVTADIASTAIASASLGVPAEDVASGKLGLAKSLASGLQPVLSAYLNRESIKLREKEVFESWYEMAPTCPQLYLYSDSDPLVSSSEVERYMKIQESRGVEVGSHKFAGSGHCEHYRRHPHEYAFVVSQFLSRALADW